MFDFQGTLDKAKDCEASGDFALATFHYWLIGFAYEDEEFPYAYTDEIGSKGRKGFLKHIKNIEIPFYSRTHILTLRTN